MKDIRVFKRGQVWMVEENQLVTDAKIASNEHVIAKTRPCLIITDTEMLSNSTDCMIQCIPISSQTKYLYEDDVVFTNASGDLNRILVSQITSRDKRSFSYYMYSFTSNMMERIDDLLNRRLNLNEITNPRADELSKENEKLKEKIKNLKKVINTYYVKSIKKEDNKPTIYGPATEEVLCEDDKLDTEEEHKIVPDIPPVKKSDECKVGCTPKYKKPEDTKKVVKATKKKEEISKSNTELKKKKYRKWTEEMAKELIEFFDEFGAKETASYYSMTETGIRTTYNRMKERYNL